MRKLLFIIILVFTALSVNAQSKVIDCNYRRVFDIKTMHIDYNQDYKAQENEVYDFQSNTNAKFYIRNEYHKTEGNIIFYKLIINKGKKHKEFSDYMKDVFLIKGDNRYVIGNKFDELQIGVTRDGDKWILFISNPSLLMK